MQRSLTGLDLDTSYRIRTPRRKTGHAAQLWGHTGHWDLGTYPAKYLAENAARLFAATSPIEGSVGDDTPAKWRPHRSNSHAPSEGLKFGAGRGRAWVRRVKGNAWQSRPWVGGFGSLNLGLFTQSEYGASAESRAAQLSKAFDQLWQGETTVGAAVAVLKGRPANARVRVRADIEVPEAARSKTRAAPRAQASERRACGIAARFPRDLWGNEVDTDELIGAWAEAEEEREKYAERLQLAITQDAPNEDRLAFDGLVEVSTE